MLVLFETSAGYALFKMSDKGKLKDVKALNDEFSTPEGAANVVKLKAFQKFEDTTKALAGAVSICEGKLDKGLKKFLKASITEKSKLAVGDLKLGQLIKEKLDIKCVFDDSVGELLRGIRSNLDTLLSGISPHDREAMKLGLSHSLCRYKLKFSPDKVDTMIVQAIALLDELDKELNTYAMRAREWYGWHFPEMGKLVADNIHFAKIVKKMGFRTECKNMDLSDIVDEDTEQAVKEAAEVSMGTEISTQDIENIQELCDQVIEIYDYRASLFEYLKNRMNAIAPNLSVMVGELVGARLIAHAGSVLNLAKHPASTVQIMGAEKALFRALKTKHATPKYGLIYHASLVGQAAPKNKGKISRVLAAKTSLAARQDALGTSDDNSLGLEAREKVENRLQQLEGRKINTFSASNNTTTPSKHKMNKDAKTYNDAADSADMEIEEAPKTPKSERKKSKKDKKEKKEKRKAEADVEEDDEDSGSSKKEKKEKKKKKKQKKNDE